MSKTLACRVGRHDWVTEMRRFDNVEAARPIDICTRCGRQRSSGGQFDFGQGGGRGTGHHSDAGGGWGGGDG